VRFVGEEEAASKPDYRKFLATTDRLAITSVFSRVTLAGPFRA